MALPSSIVCAGSSSAAPNFSTIQRCLSEMPNISAMMPSKYLKQEDFPEPRLVTIRTFTQDNVAQEGKPAEMKWVMHFDEFERGMVMNPTNLTLCAEALRSEETDDWVGRKIVLFVDPTVMMAGKRVGGVRIRAPRQPRPPAAPAAAPAPTPIPAEYTRSHREPAAPPPHFDDDDIPF